MKKHVLVFSVLTLATSVAFAWTPGSQQCVDWLRQHGSNHPDCQGTTLPPATPATPALTAEQQQQQAQQAIAAILARLQQEQTANGGQGGAGGNASATGGLSQNDLQVVNDNWNRLSASAQNEFRATISGMNSSSRAQLENAINNASSATASANGAAGNTTTTTIGGAVYNMGRPVEAARVGLKPDIRSDAKMSRIVTDCDGDFTVAKEEGEDGQVQATTSTWFGLGSSTRPNGAVYKIVPTAPPTVSKWELIGVDEQQRPIYEQVTRGFQAIITEYIVGADAQSGLNVNGEKLAAATGAAAGAQSYGNHIKKIACSVTKHRIMYPVPVKPVDVCPNIEGVQTTIPPGMKKDDDGQCIVPPAQPPAAAAPALDQDKAPFMTGERRYLGPITPRETDTCPFTKPDGKVIRVKKQPGQICASEPITRPAVTDARLKDGKK